jgi:hypothetical protein
MMLTGEVRSSRRKPCPIANSTLNPKLTGPGSNANHRDEKLTVNLLSLRTGDSLHEGFSTTPLPTSK